MKSQLELNKKNNQECNDIREINHKSFNVNILEENKLKEKDKNNLFK